MRKHEDPDEVWVMMRDAAPPFVAHRARHSEMLQTR